MLRRDQFKTELEKWRELNRVPKLWWRDDDAITHTRNLDVLFELAAKYGFTLALSVIPRDCDTSLVRGVRHCGVACVWQHGWSHIDHGQQSEFGSNRSLDDSLRDVSNGKGRMDDMFGRDGWNPVFVPPWNTISPDFASALQSLGFWGVSTGKDSIQHADIKSIKIDVDIIDWRDFPTFRFCGLDRCLQQLLHALVRRRLANRFDHPIGLLTHHLFNDPEIWTGLDEFLSFSVFEMGVERIDARTLLRPAN